MPRSVASRRSLLDHHIPSSELGILPPIEIDHLKEMQHPEGTVSAPTSPTNRSDLASTTHQPLYISTDGVQQASSSRGPPRSALPDFASPPARDIHGDGEGDGDGNKTEPGMADSPSTIQSARPYPQPGPSSGLGPDPLTGVSRPPPPPEIPHRVVLSEYMAQHPDHTVKQAINKHFPLPNPLFRLFKRFRVKHSVIEGMTPEEIKHWEAQRDVLMRKAGWKMEGTEGPGTEVTELFWKVSPILVPSAG